MNFPPSDPRRSVHRSYDAQFHGTSEHRGGNCPSSHYYESGRFGRMFGGLPAVNIDPLALIELGKPGGLMDGLDQGPGENPRNPDHPGGLPAGFTFLGQFIDHDITFDPTSSLERQVDPEAVANFRTPCLELDNVYGSGPGASPHLYQRSDRARLLLGSDTSDAVGTDLPRNHEETALLGDPRNDENLIVSQLHLAFLRFHNAVVDRIIDALPGSGAVRHTIFERAQRSVRWHYQWIVLKQYLPAIVGEPMVSAVLANRRFYRWRREPFIPVEFAVAAFRFGHTQVRPGYAISDQFAAPLFALPTPQQPSPPSLGGGKRIDPPRVIDWRRFFAIDPSAPPAASKAFDPVLSSPLMRLPFARGGLDDPQSLAQRNLLRGLTFGLPSGQAVAAAMIDEHAQDVASTPGLSAIEPLTTDELEELRPLGLETDTPLWYYILKESQLREDGRRLGAVGGRIVAEVLVGLLQGDPMSFLSASPRWKPNLNGGESFGIEDLLRIAGVSG